MTKDHILGWTLVLLVGISLFLSSVIWSQAPFDLFTKTEYSKGQTTQLDSIICPEKILVYTGNLGNTSQTMLRQSSHFYDETWDISKNFLATLWTQAPEAVEGGKELFIRKKSIEVFFATPLPASFIKQLLDVKGTDVPAFDSKYISSYILVEDKGLSGYLVDDEGQLYKLGNNDGTLKLENLITDIVDSGPASYARLSAANMNLRMKDGLYVSLLSYDMPTYKVKREPMPGERQISSFFNDFSVARKIQERDGAVIYTDGQRGLRIYSNGALEYSSPVAKDQKRDIGFYEALKVAVDFVNTHGGWPHGSYLDSYEVQSGQTGKSYGFTFCIYTNGYSIIDPDNLITVTVEGSQVKNYYRHVIASIKQEGLLELMTPINALDTAVSTKNIRLVDDLYPGYIIVDDLLKPVWVLKTSGMEVIIQNPSE